MFSATGRQRLDRLYQWSGYAAALCLMCIALTVVAKILGRCVGLVIDSTETAGFFLAGATFPGLAHTFKTGDHIRVTLLTRLATGNGQRCTLAQSVGYRIVCRSDALHSYHYLQAFLFAQLW